MNLLNHVHSVLTCQLCQMQSNRTFLCTIKDFILQLYRSLERPRLVLYWSWENLSWKRHKRFGKGGKSYQTDFKIIKSELYVKDFKTECNYLKNKKTDMRFNRSFLKIFKGYKNINKYFLTCHGPVIKVK